MEDSHCIIPNLTQKFNLNFSQEIPHAFFGIFDGHGGSEASEFSSKFLVNFLVSSPSFVSDVKEALIHAYLQTDVEFMLKAEDENLYSGTTAVVSFIRGSV